MHSPAWIQAVLLVGINRQQNLERTSVVNYTTAVHMKCWVVGVFLLPLCGLFIHDQRDVALDQGEGEEADVVWVFTGCSRLFLPGKDKNNTVFDWTCDTLINFSLCCLTAWVGRLVSVWRTQGFPFKKKEDFEVRACVQCCPWVP